MLRVSAVGKITNNLLAIYASQYIQPDTRDLCLVIFLTKQLSDNVKKTDLIFVVSDKTYYLAQTGAPVLTEKMRNARDLRCN